MSDRKVSFATGSDDELSSLTSEQIVDGRLYFTKTGKIYEGYIDTDVNPPVHKLRKCSADITIDSIPTSESPNAVSSGGVYTAIHNITEEATQVTQIPIDTTVTQNSGNLITSGAVYTALSNKQNTISDLNTIRSGAALGATSIQSHQDISGKQDKPIEKTTIDTPVQNNTIYNLTNVSNLTVTYPTGNFMCVIRLTTGSGTPSITLPNDTVYCTTAPVFGANERWEISIHNKAFVGAKFT